MRVLKVAVSAALLSVLVALIDWRQTQEILGGFPATLAIAVVAIFGIQFVVSSWKWSIALLANGVRVPFGVLVRTYCIGYFFSNFLPSNVGGDIYRVYRTRGYCSVPVATFAVLMDRLTGLFALILVAAIGALWLFLQSEGATLIVVVLGALLTLGYFIVPILAISALQKTETWKKYIPARLRAIVAAIDMLMSNKLRLVGVLGISLLYQIIATLAFVLLFLGIGESWMIAESAVANGAGSIAAILPISINGLGITEASFAGVASQFGVDFTQATIVSFLTRILVFPFVALFGVMYMFETKVSPDEIASTVKADSF